jgi:hypothetical protein
MESRQPLLPLKAVAKALGIRPENVRAEADAGRLPHTKLGDDYLFSLPDVESALLKRARGKAVSHAH